MTKKFFACDMPNNRNVRPSCRNRVVLGQWMQIPCVPRLPNHSRENITLAAHNFYRLGELPLDEQQSLITHFLVNNHILITNNTSLLFDGLFFGALVPYGADQSLATR